MAEGTINLRLQLDPDTISWGDLEDLEQSTSLHQMRAWLETHGALDAEGAKALKAVRGIENVKAAAKDIREQVLALFAVPK